MDLGQAAAGWLGVAAKTIVVLALAWLVVALASRLIDQVMAGQVRRREETAAGGRRLLTLAAITKSVLRYTVVFLAGVTVLGLWGINTSSLLLGAGVAGLAVGFGAQSLVRDVLSGFFILLEDQFAVGDYVNLGTVEGTVREMGLRATRLEAPGGETHIVPNGSVQRVTNYSRGPLRVLFDVAFSYDEDTSRVIKVAQETLDRYAAASEVVVEGPKVLGVSRMGPAGVSLTVWAKVKPMRQAAVERELKLLLKEAFAGAGVEVFRREPADRAGPAGRAPRRGKEKG